MVESDGTEMPVVHVTDYSSVYTKISAASPSL